MVSARTLLEVAVMAAVIAAIWGLMALPIVFYYIPRQSDSDNTTELDALLSCTPTEYVYKGEVCRDTLLALKQCILSQSPDNLYSEDVSINIAEGIDSQISEQLALIGEQYLQTQDSSQDCVAELVPFLCQYLFTPCDERGVAYYPSSEDCVYIRDQVCVSEWEKLTTFADYLPNCESLPDDSLCSLDGTVENDLFVSATNGSTDLSSTDVSSPLNCSAGFVYIEEVHECRPHCPSWEEHEHGLSIAYRAITATSIAVSVLASTAVLFLSCVRYKRMFSFPLVFIVYQVVPILILGVTLLIGFTDRENLFCNSQDWLEVLDSTGTPFCAFSGVVLYYTLWQTTLWWFSHISVVFCEITFPLRARSFKALGRMKYVHIGLVIAGVLIPVIPVTAIASVGTFRSGPFPPIFCVSTNSIALFYGISFPLSILTAIGVSLIAGIIRTIIKGHYRFNRSVKANRETRKVIIKLLIIFCYFTVVSVLVLTVYTANHRNTSYVTGLQMYLILCKGDPSTTECDQNTFQQHSLTGLNLVSLILLNLYSLLCLLYAVNIKELQDRISAACIAFSKLKSKLKTVECRSTVEQVNNQLQSSAPGLRTTPDSAVTLQTLASANSIDL